MLSETRPAKVGKWTEPALRVLRERYLTRQGGEVVETPEEMCWRGAPTIARGGGRDGGGGAAGGGGRGGLYGIINEGGFLPKPPAPHEPRKGDGPPDPASHLSAV